MEDQFDKDFDRSFARDLKNAGLGGQARAEDWAALSTRLEAVAVPARRHGYLPWLLLLLLLLSNGWWAWYRTKPAAVTDLGTVVLTDTVRQTIMVYDTIRRTVPVDRLVPVNRREQGHQLSKNIKKTDPDRTLVAQSTGDAPGAPLSGTGQSAMTVQAPGAAKPVANDFTAGQQAKTVDDTTSTIKPADAARLQPNTTDSSVVDVRMEPETSATTAPAADKPEQVSQDVSTNAAPPAPTKPHRQGAKWQVGLALGLPTAIAVDDLDLSEAKVAQLQLICRFSRHWSATASVLWQRYHYEQEHHFGSDLGFDVPPPPGQDYVLRQLKSESLNMLPALSLQYHLWPGRRCGAYLGAGYALRLSRLDDTSLEYKQIGSGLLYREELSGHIWGRGGALTLQSGVNWSLRSRWTLWGGLQGWVEPGHWRRTAPALNILLGVNYRIK